MADLIRILESFNRKERYFLLCEALGLEKGFALSKDFLGSLREALSMDVPESAYVAMDYHLDWLAASLELYKSGNDADATFTNREDTVGGKTTGLIRGNQEDVDLLVAFQSNSGQYHVVLIEAKAYSDWDSKQLSSKAARLKQVFGADGKQYESVKPHFLVAGPNESQGLEEKAKGLPVWMKRENKLMWLTLCLPKERRVVERKLANGSYESFRVYKK